MNELKVKSYLCQNTSILKVCRKNKWMTQNPPHDCLRFGLTGFNNLVYVSSAINGLLVIKI